MRWQHRYYSTSAITFHDTYTFTVLLLVTVAWLRKDNVTVLLLPSSIANHTFDLIQNISDITNFLMLSNDKSKLSIIIYKQEVSLDYDLWHRSSMVKRSMVYWMWA